MAQDSQLPRSTRVELLQKFLDEFANDNPHQQQARKMIAVILPGTLSVRTQPPGAWVSIDGTSQGRSPITIQLASGDYQVRAFMDGHEDRYQEASLKPGGKTELSLELKRFYPMDPMTKWGHVSFWSGLGVTVLGGLAAWQMSGKRDEYSDGSWSAKEDIELWTGMMFTGLGTGVLLMGAGAIMWIMAPSDEEWHREWDGRKSVGLSPTRQGGLVLTFGGEW